MLIKSQMLHKNISEFHYVAAILYEYVEYGAISWKINILSILNNRFI